jgi:hypothetical protein
LGDGGAIGVDAVEDGDNSVELLGEEDVAVGGGEEVAGAAEVGGVEGDFEAGRGTMAGPLLTSVVA